MVLNEWSKGAIVPAWGARLNPFSKLAMAAIVAINGSVVAPYLMNFSLQLAMLAVIIIVIATMGYLLGLAFSRLMGWNYADKVALIFNGGMRNISAGAVLAVTYFPAPVAVPVVLGMVFQQTLASLAGYLLGRHAKSHQQSDTAFGS
ncbi:hypothetical protein D3C77_323330 [compost metagenome]